MIYIEIYLNKVSTGQSYFSGTGEGTPSWLIKIKDFLLTYKRHRLDLQCINYNENLYINYIIK